MLDEGRITPRKARIYNLKLLAETDSEVTEVIPGILISSLAGALMVQKDTCKSMLSLNQKLKKNPLASRFNLEFKEIPFQEDAPDELLVHLHECIQFLEEASRPVLIYSFFGKNRAPTVLAAYLLFKQRATSVKEALNMIQEKRPGSCPEADFIRQLGKFASVARDINEELSTAMLPGMIETAWNAECSLDVEMLAQTVDNARSESASDDTKDGDSGLYGAAPPMRNGDHSQKEAKKSSPLLNHASKAKPPPKQGLGTEASASTGTESTMLNRTDREVVSPTTSPVIHKSDRGTRIATLKRLKESAIRNEDYEQAAKIRDEIEKLESQGPSLQELEAMKQKAVENEDFELAGKIRDVIKGLIPVSALSASMQQPDVQPQGSLQRQIPLPPETKPYAKRQQGEANPRVPLTAKEREERLEKLMRNIKMREEAKKQPSLTTMGFGERMKLYIPAIIVAVVMVYSINKLVGYGIKIVQEEFMGDSSSFDDEL